MGLISRHSIDSVLEANDIVEVVSSYVSLDKKSSFNLFGLCPFHEEKTPSFSVSPGKQIFYCFGCQKGGNVIKFIQEIEHLSYPQAIRFLADRAGVTIEEDEDGFWKDRFDRQRDAYEALREAAGFFYRTLEGPEGKEGRDYLAKRGIDRRLYRKYGLGYAPARGRSLYEELKDKGIKDQVMEEAGLILPDRRQGEGYYDFFRHRVTFPIIDPNGRVLAFGGRALLDKGPKYINSPDTLVYQKGKHMFGIPQAVKSSSKFWYLVEGYMDVLALARAGIDHSVAPLGTALTLDQARLIGRYVDRVLILMDSDRAGREASLRAGEILERAGLKARYIFLKEAKDPDDCLKALGPQRFLDILSRPLDRTGYLLALLDSDRTLAIGMSENEYRDRALDLLAAEADSTRREIYGGQLAKELQISRRAVTEEIERRRGLSKDQSQSKVASSQTGERLRPARRREGGDASQEEWLLLTLLALHNRLSSLGPRIRQARLEGFALQAESLDYLTSKEALAPLVPEDFLAGPMREIGLQVLEGAKEGRLTLASLHSIVDSILVDEDDPSREREDFIDPDRAHAGIQKHYQTLEESQLSPDDLEGIYLQKLTEVRMARWRRQAAQINEEAYELEMEGSDLEARQNYERANRLLTAAEALRMIIQGEN